MRRRGIRPVHPGEMLRLDFLPDYRLSCEQLATSLRLPIGDVGQILDERRPVDADFALRLARFFGSSPEMWMALQRDVDFFDALEAGGTSIDAIHPIDQSASTYEQEREPLPEEFAQQLREQIVDLKDDTRWLIRSAWPEDDLEEDDLLTCTYYEVSSDCWAVGIEHGTRFKREWAAKAVAAGLRDGVRVIAVTRERFERALREEVTDMAARKRYLRRSRENLRDWSSDEILRTEDDMIAYLELAAEERDSGLLSSAVRDVLSVMREECGRG